MDLWKSETSLVYLVSSGPARAMRLDSVYKQKHLVEPSHSMMVPLQTKRLQSGSGFLQERAQK